MPSSDHGRLPQEQPVKDENDSIEPQLDGVSDLRGTGLKQLREG